METGPLKHFQYTSILSHGNLCGCNLQLFWFCGDQNSKRSIWKSVKTSWNGTKIIQITLLDHVVWIHRLSPIFRNSVVKQKIIFCRLKRSLPFGGDKDERECLFKSHSEPFIPIAAPSNSARFYSYSLPSSIGYFHPLRCQSHVIVPVAAFMYIMKQITSKLTTKWCLR